MEYRVSPLPCVDPTIALGDPPCMHSACMWIFFSNRDEKNPTEIPRVLAYGSSVTVFFLYTRKFVHFVYTVEIYVGTRYYIYICVCVYCVLSGVSVDEAFLDLFCRTHFVHFAWTMDKKKCSHRSVKIRLSVWKTHTNKRFRGTTLDYTARTIFDNFLLSILLLSDSQFDDCRNI